MVNCEDLNIGENVDKFNKNNNNRPARQVD